MTMQKIIELMESIADCLGQIAKYRAYVNEHPDCGFEWENKIVAMEKKLSQMELKLQVASFAF